MSETKKKLCPRCKVFPLDNDPAMNAISHDGKTMICSECGRIESLEALNPDMAYGLKLGIRRCQAAMYGLDKNGDPKLPKDEPIEEKLISKELKEEIDAWERTSIADWDKTEDKIRKSKRKSIREGGKYKARGKEKRREP